MSQTIEQAQQVDAARRRSAVAEKYFDRLTSAVVALLAQCDHCSAVTICACDLIDEINEELAA